MISSSESTNFKIKSNMIFHNFSFDPDKYIVIIVDTSVIKIIWAYNVDEVDSNSMEGRSSAETKVGVTLKSMQESS